jgi:hypothetical protein
MSRQASTSDYDQRSRIRDSTGLESSARPGIITDTIDGTCPVNLIDA